MFFKGCLRHNKGLTWCVYSCFSISPLFPHELQAISFSWMINLDNAHAVNLDTSMKTPYQIASSSSNSLIMQSMSFTTTPIPGTGFANRSLVFFGVRDINNPGNFKNAFLCVQKKILNLKIHQQTNRALASEKIQEKISWFVDGVFTLKLKMQHILWQRKNKCLEILCYEHIYNHQLLKLRNCKA